MHVDDGVGVVVQDAGVQGFHDVVAGGESGKEHVADLVEGHGLVLGACLTKRSRSFTTWNSFMSLRGSVTV